MGVLRTSVFRSRSVAAGLEPAIRGLGLQRIVFEWVLLPEILLTEPDDVILFEPAVVVKGFILGNEVLVPLPTPRAADGVHQASRAQKKDRRVGNLPPPTHSRW